MLQVEGMEEVGEEVEETVEAVVQSLLNGNSDSVIRSRRRDLPELLHRYQIILLLHPPFFLLLS